MKSGQPVGPLTGAVIDGPNWTDPPETTGIHMDNKWGLRICGSGWRKMTTFSPLQIHQLLQEPLQTHQAAVRGGKEWEAGNDQGEAGRIYRKAI